MLMFPSFETAIRKRSGEECEVAGSQERYNRNQRRPQAACRRVMPPATCNTQEYCRTREDTEEHKDNSVKSNQLSQLLLIRIAATYTGYFSNSRQNVNKYYGFI